MQKHCIVAIALALATVDNLRSFIMYVFAAGEVVTIPPEGLNHAGKGPLLKGGCLHNLSGYLISHQLVPDKVHRKTFVKPSRCSLEL